jgi:hypothetical protein
MAKRAIAKKEESQLELFEERPAWMKDAERGSEDVTTDDITLPRIDLVQDLSPQIKRNKPEYIEGAEPGMLFNTVTKELYGEGGLIFIPVYFNKVWIIWKDRDSGGGLRGIFDTEAEAKQALAALEDGNLCEINDTAQHYGLVRRDNGDLQEVVISMSKSKLKASRQLNTLVRVAGGDRFSRAYRVESAEDSGSKGDYWNLKITQLGFVDEHTYASAESMYESVKAGQRGVNYNEDPDSDDTEY